MVAQEEMTDMALAASTNFIAESFLFQIRTFSLYPYSFSLYR